jgi:hypothetical protein
MQAVRDLSESTQQARAKNDSNLQSTFDISRQKLPNIFLGIHFVAVGLAQGHGIGGGRSAHRPPGKHFVANPPLSPPATALRAHLWQVAALPCPCRCAGRVCDRGGTRLSTAVSVPSGRADLG